MRDFGWAKERKGREEKRIRFLKIKIKQIQFKFKFKEFKFKLKLKQMNNAMQHECKAKRTTLFNFRRELIIIF